MVRHTNNNGAENMATIQITDAAILDCLSTVSKYVVTGGELIAALAHIEHGDVLGIDTDVKPSGYQSMCYVAPWYDRVGFEASKVA